MGVRIPLHNVPVVRSETDPALERHRRNWIVPGIGREGQARLEAARVLVVGAGGLGSPLLLYLTAAGVGTLGVCDSDVVELANLARQLLHGEADVGMPKPQSAAKQLGMLDSQVKIEQYPHVTREFLDAHGSEWDLVVDCTDNFAAKYLVGDWCAESGVPFVWGTVVGMSFQVSVFWSKPPAGVPVTKLRMLHPDMPAPGTTPASPKVGVLGPVVGQTGTAQATEVVKLLTGVGEPLIGKALVADVARNRYTTLTFAAVGDSAKDAQ
jgi:molybdopterin/thiamine biosynthesis adenylyltransferase